MAEAYSVAKSKYGSYLKIGVWFSECENEICYVALQLGHKDLLKSDFKKFTKIVA